MLLSIHDINKRHLQEVDMETECCIILLFILVCILVAAAMAIEEEVVRACEAFSFDEE